MKALKASGFRVWGLGLIGFQGAGDLRLVDFSFPVRWHSAELREFVQC